MTDIIKLDSRLSLAASLVKGSYVADIGTDHAYIPIYLLQSGKCNRAIAADINCGPLNNARENVAANGLSDKVCFYLCDGLSGIDLTEVSDIVICGMGGELIAKIIEACPSLKESSSPRLILQPMSAIEDLRMYLAENGFEICNGGVTEAAGKLYQCFACTYTGKQYSLSAAEAIVGRTDEKIRDGKLYPALLGKYINRTKKEIFGRPMGSLDTSSQEALLAQLLEIEKGIDK